MCGIVGFTGVGDLDDLRRMNDRLTHRGPDGSGLWRSPEHDASPTFLGHRRLAIIDLADGAQPMSTHDGQLTITFNGEIYNHLALRQALTERGHHFSTDHCDTEVLLHGYREWGHAVVNKLNGMWAFAIYDQSKRKLFLSRDRFGQKPLYYSRQNDCFAFASELTSLIEHPAIDASVSPIAVKKYFAYGYIPAPHSYYKQIYKLPAGSNLVISTHDLSVTEQRYWEYLLEPDDEYSRQSEGELAEQFLALLDQAVDRRLMSDVPLGVFLSGGVDSSAVTASASLTIGDANTTLRTFAIGFAEDSFDESPFAAKVADRYETRHTMHRLPVDDALKLMPRVADRLDEPMGDASLIPTYLLCETARRDVTVALGGDGADELMCGYAPFKALRQARRYQRFIPRPIHKAIRLAASWLPVSHRYMNFGFRLNRVLRGVGHPAKLWNPLWMSPLSPDELAECFNEPVDIEEIYEEAINAWERQPGLGDVDRTTRFFVNLYLQDNILTKVDRASMMHSLEVRSPFLDIDLVNFIRRLPWTCKLNGNTTKHLLKVAMAERLPQQILTRRKQGFALPTGQWLKDNSIRLGDDADLSSQARHGMHPPFCERLLNEHRRGKADHRLYLWNQWVLSRHQI